jgi:UDP-glucose 4-epimerase
MKSLVTGGSGFLGLGLCAELVNAGHEVRVLDNHSRGRASRLDRFRDQIELIECDIRNLDDVMKATEGCEVVWHLAYINGTRSFYERPDDVLEIAVKGAMNTLEAALAQGVRRYVLASSSETYNLPTHLPTTESERLMIPDVTNPRFSYGGGKITSELLTLHFGGHRGLETVIFRPHNFYGPDMGFEHVIPELVCKIIEQSDNLTRSAIELPIQGDGSETRSFCYVDDGARGAFISGDKGGSGEIYHIGTEEEITIRHLVELLGRILGVEVEIVPGEIRAGGTPRRCPSIEKLGKLGYEPQVSLEEGLKKTVEWYVEWCQANVKPS